MPGASSFHGGLDLVSIVIPCYNPSACLIDAIASARSQSHREIEIILVNDGSDQAQAQSLVERASSKADLFLNQPNRGLPSARNAGFRMAHGQYVVPLDADDLILPDYVAECLAALKASPEAAFAYTACRVFGTQNYVDEPGGYNLYRLLDRNFLTYAAMIRKRDWEQAGGYDESMRFGYEDWEFWLRLGARNRYGVYVPLPLFQYRKHGLSLYDVALSRHAEITAYIQRQHPELYGYPGRARIKSCWSPAVCLIGPAPATPQSIEDIEVRGAADHRPLGERSGAPAFLLCDSDCIDSHSAEMAALAVWSGRAQCKFPDGSLVLSRKAAESLSDRKRASRDRFQPPKDGAASQDSARAGRVVGTWGVLHRHLTNAELLSWESWLKHPWRSALRLIPLRLKEGINKAAGHPVFNLSFYLQFQPSTLVVRNALIQPLRYFPKPASGRSRIALITPHLGPGGAEAVLLEIASALHKERFEILLLATQSLDNRWAGRWRSRVEHVYDLSTAAPPERITATVFTIVSNWRCDAVLVQNSLSGYAALPHIKCEASGVQVIDLIHAIDDRWDQISVTAEVASHIDLRVAVSEAITERLLASGTPRNRVRLIRNGVDLERFRPSPVRSEGPPRILFAGRLDPVKRPLLLVKIAARLAALRKARDFQVVVAGDGPEAGSLRQTVRRSGLESVFDFRGYVDDMAPVFAASDVCVLPSRVEGIPLVVLEALASSRPVVASNVGAIREVLDLGCGVLIDVAGDEPREFAAALNHLLDHPELRRKMGTAGRCKMEAEYDLRRTREAYLRVLDR